MQTRCFTFGVYYLSSIQQGIQAAHAVANMMAKYADEESPQRNLVMQWATEDKTLVCLNAGNHQDLLNITPILADSKYPWDVFQESEEDLGSIFTCAACVLPGPVYLAAEVLRKHRDPADGGLYLNYGTEEHLLLAYRARHPLDNKDLEIATMISKLGLAR